jgi:hypothetical protein
VREMCFKKWTYLKDSGRMSMTSSLTGDCAKPVERFIQKELKGKYTKGRTHPNNPLLVVPYGPLDKLPNEGKTFLDDFIEEGVQKNFMDSVDHYE